MKLNTFQKTAIATVCATIFLIFVGGLVRVSGSGLGCPDWPQCFGSWMPPLSASDLPAGFDAAQFNGFKTWTEYINRLVGVVTGLLIAATFLLSLRYRKRDRSIIYSSAVALILVPIQAWLGGQVVETGLNEQLITAHLVLAIAIVIALVYAVFRATREKWVIEVESSTKRGLVWAAAILFVCTVVQLVLGAQVREGIDQVKDAALQPRANWVSAAGYIVEIHRSFAWTVLLSGLTIFYLSKWKTNSALLNKMSIGIMGVIIFQIVLGVGLYYLGLPPVYQVLHLVGVAVLICAEFLFLLMVGTQQKPTVLNGG